MIQILIQIKTNTVFGFVLNANNIQHCIFTFLSLFLVKSPKEDISFPLQSPSHNCIPSRYGNAGFFYLQIPNSISFFHFITFLYFFLHMFRNEGIWKVKWSKSQEQRCFQRNRRFPSRQGCANMLAAVVPGLKAWRKPPYLSMSTHSAPGYFQGQPKSPLADTTTWKVLQYFPWKKRSCYYGSEDAEMDSFLS